MTEYSLAHKKLHSLRTLVVPGQASPRFLSATEAVECIQELDLRLTECDHAIIEQLASLVSSSTVLKNLTFTVDKVRKIPSLSLSQACSRSTSLTSLILRGLAFSADDVDAFAYLLQTSRRLYQLEIGILHTPEAFNQVVEALIRNRPVVICKLHISFPVLSTIKIVESIKDVKILQILETQRTFDDRFDFYVENQHMKEAV